MESPSQGRIFRNSAQQGLRIFIEPIEVPNRPKLIRTLKAKLGATTCEDVAEADIILVTPDTESSSELIQGWNEKVVLDVDWAYESIRRGTPYLEDENWGGFIINAGAGASGSSATVHNPLPTPRETPSEPQPQLQQDAAMQQQQAPLPQQSQFVQGGSPVPMSQFPQQQFPQQFPGGQPVPMQGVPQNYPFMVPATMPATMYAQLMGLAQQSGMGMPQLPVNMLPAGQPIPSGYMQQPFPFIAQPGMFPQGSFPLPQQLINMSYPQLIDAGSPVSGSSYHNSSSPDMQRNGSVSTSYRGSPMDQDERHATPDDEGRHAGSSSRAAVQSAQRRRDDHQDASGGLKLFTKRPGEPYLFFVQVEIRNRAKIADPIKKYGGKLVADISQADFVILGHPATRNFEEWLRQSAFYHKLPLKPQWVFDCVEEEEILDVEEYVYEGLGVERKRGRPSKTGQRYILTAVKSGSEDEDESEDDNDDEEQERRVAKKRKIVDKPVKQEKVKAEKQKTKTEKKEKIEKKEKKERKRRQEEVQEEKGPKKKANSKAVHDEDTTKTNGKGKQPAKNKGKAPAMDTGETQQSVSRGPQSPPPPTIVVEHSRNKNYYTKEDLDYLDEYIPILLARDHTMSNTTISEKLHAKMPHHSVGSWSNQLTSRREKLAQLRRRAEIQSRKVAAQAAEQPSTSQAAEPGAPSSPSVASASTSARPVAVDSVPADPFKIMTEFFANGRADSLEDAAVWRVLAQEHPELDAQQWAEYWSTNGNRIAEEVARLTGLQSPDVNGGGPKAEPQ
ncbi:hypothetical protein K466DRAFT_593630 [Polyporus arcularius HHB13444]|uniref:BRCT domain-containing protein n=1 Tax=Polyporus arcularius HHB13444 TaxID=1314778 RepID=A0A5C3PXM2_9APHY|nr:hypothetical protein K466DRAFT_593630 [Polyporus arcularius HHB13444]